MRWLPAVFLCLFAASALAQEWGRYVNARFGYVIDIPPGFSESALAPTNGDGQIFAHQDGKAELRVWGTNVLDGFPVEFDTMAGLARSEGWDVSIPAGFATNAAFEGRRRDERVAVHAINYCGGALLAAFQLTYEADLEASMIRVISQLSRSLDPADGFMCP